MRKRRTRQHIIEDLGFNNIEKQILLAGFVMERYLRDYTTDGNIRTFDSNGEIEPGIIDFQLKSTEKIKVDNSGNQYKFSLSKRDLETWLFEPMPVLLFLYDAQKETSYYLEIKKYFQEQNIQIEKINKFIQVLIPAANEFTVEVIKELRNIKNLAI